MPVLDQGESARRLPYDPFRGAPPASLRELLEEIFSDNIEMMEEGDGDPFAGPDALTVHSRVWGDEDLPLHEAARRGNAYCVKMLLEAGADANAKGDLSVSPLYYAVSSGCLEVARLLLDAGARIDVVNELGCSDLGACSPGGCRANAKMYKLLQSRWPGVVPDDIRKRKF